MTRPVAGGCHAGAVAEDDGGAQIEEARTPDGRRVLLFTWPDARVDDAPGPSDEEA